MIKIKKFFKRFNTVNFLHSIYREKRLSNWKSFEASNIKPKKSSKILFATNLGDYEMGVLLESTLSVALKLRGADVDAILCNGDLTACQLVNIHNYSDKLLAQESNLPRCSACINYGKRVFSNAGINTYSFSQFLTDEDKSYAKSIASSIKYDDISSFIFLDCKVGEHAQAGALRYFARGSLIGEENGEKVLRKYLESSILTVIVFTNLFKSKSYDAVCFHHGIYVPQGLVTQVCKREGVRVITWNPAYKKNCFIFSHEDTYHHTMIKEDVTLWNSKPLSTKETIAIEDYLESRRSGLNDWIWFHNEPQEEKELIEKELGIDFNKPTVTLFTNVIWDAQLHYSANAFTSMIDWIICSIKYFAKRDDLNLVIRIHPAENSGAIPSRQKVLDEINSFFKEIPKNIFIISPESKISSYALMESSNACTIFNTKTGIEICSKGIPCIVAGEAWIRNKGFAVDVSSEDEYIHALSKLPFTSKLSKEKIDLAKAYAFHFFMRRMIPLPFINFDKNKQRYNLNLQNLSELDEGSYPGLDVICKGIIHGEPFIHFD